MGFLRKMFPTRNDKELKKIEKQIVKIEALADTYSAMTDEQLTATTETLKGRYAAGESLDALLPDAFALVREAAARKIGLRHYRVQLIGGVGMHQGMISEMKTGEGKTLVATLPAYLNALSGKGVHIVTVNEYLAQRDADWMGKVFRFLGLTVGVITAGMFPAEKQKAYLCDIVYATNSELGFDYLRDNRATHKSQLMQRGLNYAIIDEVDSILIDDSRTPLIISDNAGKSTRIYKDVDDFARRLKRDVDFEIDEKDRTIKLLEEGFDKVERHFKLPTDGENDIDINNYVRQALRARHLMHRDQEYMVQDGQILIIDENTGRAMIGRRYNEGLHQAIEAKEGVKVQNESRTIASITYQNFFRMYTKLAGMTGTAKTEETEFHNIYGLDVLEVPTNAPMIRVDENDQIFQKRDVKLAAIVEDIKDCYDRGQPVLVGTISIEKSEELSELLDKAKIPHVVLNAKKHEKEAFIVAQAGKLHAVTVATNMAGRGTDILLGGNAEMQAKSVLEQEYLDKAIALRNNDDSVVVAYLKTAFAEIFSKYNDLTTEEKQMVLGTNNLKEVSDRERNVMLIKPAVHKLMEVATDMQRNTDEITGVIRERYLALIEEYKPLIAAEKQQVLDAGGLRIVGTERHESRRIDNQLRGRSGRQGDKGSSVFYVSIEDDMIRIFGGGKLESKLGAVMERFDMGTSEAMSMRAMNSMVERAQKIMESRHYSARKHILSYDDVINNQREIIYKERTKVLNEENVHEEILDMMHSICEDMVGYFADFSKDCSEWDFDSFNDAINDRVITREGEDVVNEDNVRGKSKDELTDFIYEEAKGRLESRRDEINEGGGFVYLNATGEEVGRQSFDAFERMVLLTVVDRHWTDHIDAMDTLRKGIGFRSYGQKDPVVAYRQEGFDMFDNLIYRIRCDTVMELSHRLCGAQQRMQKKGKAAPKVMGGKRPGRNDPCPCGSGKKYKNCCMPGASSNND